MIAYVILYLLFNVFFPTLVRLCSTLDEDCGRIPSLSRKQWLISLLPILGLMFIVYLLFKKAWN